MTELPASSRPKIADSPPAIRRPRPSPVDWPNPAGPASPVLLGGAAVAGILAAALLPGQFGLNVPIVAVAAVAALFPVARRTRTAIVFAALAMGLLALPVLVDAGWFTTLAVLLAVPLGSYALAGGRTWIELLGGGLWLPVSALRAVPWTFRGLAVLGRSGRRPLGPIVGSVLVTGVLLAVFGALFAGADAAFGQAISGLFPAWRADRSVASVFFFAVTTGAVLAGGLLAVAPPRFGPLPAAAPIGRTPWAIPIVALDLMFLGFAVVQADVLLASDRDRLLRSTGLTYAEYARQGFWQLLVVTGLVLAIVAVAVRYAPVGGRADRTAVRTLLGLLCALTLVVVAVALRRLYLYEEAYGWTRLRLWVHAFELWMGLVVVLIAIAGVRLKAAWLPRTIAASGAAGLLALGLVNPDGYIASHDVHRFRQTGKIDLSYVSGLSADAVPALDRLPEPQRSCALHALADTLRFDDAWAGFNFSRAHARTLLKRRPVQAFPPC